MRVSEAVGWCHEALRASVRSGDWAVDATVGNGYDTELLARLVGERGRVWGCDLQPRAIGLASERLKRGGLDARVALEVGDHATFLARLAVDAPARMRAVVFNLGYLPGGDKSLITTAATTVAAHEAAVRLLGPEGIVLTVIYWGHPGGAAEAGSLLEWAERIPAAAFDVRHRRPPERMPPGPSLLSVRRRC